MTSSSIYSSTVQSGPPLLMQHSPPTLTTDSCFWLYLLLLSLKPSRFFDVMLGVFNPGALNYFTLFHLILLTVFVSRNVTLIHLPFSESLDFLLSDLIASTPGLAFFLPIPRTLVAASSFLFGRPYSFLNFLLPLFLRLTPTLDYAGVNILLNNFSLLSLMFRLPLFAFRQIAEATPFFSILPSINLFILEDFNYHQPLGDSKDTFDSRGEKIFDWAISFDLLPFNDPDISFPSLLP